jgi:DNA-binding transcriptional MerR regulator
VRVYIKDKEETTMDYTVKALAELSGVTPRTIRYYDTIDLLKPATINASGYRIYGPAEVDRLQQILFYKALDFKLETIKKLLDAPSFDALEALKNHQQQLIEKQKRIQTLIATVTKTIKAKERGLLMNDQEKFEGFKKKLVEDNEQRYGNEIREKYGDEVINQSYQKVKNMTKADYSAVTALEQQMMNQLKEAFKTQDPGHPSTQAAVDLHRQWLSFYWDDYSKKAHAEVAQMYVADQRFKDYYDQQEPGLAAFLKEAILIYTEEK